jgi:hypothetical protein
MIRLGSVATGDKMNPTKITLVRWVSGSWTQRDGIALAEGLCDLGADYFGWRPSWLGESCRDPFPVVPWHLPQTWETKYFPSGFYTLLEFCTYSTGTIILCHSCYVHLPPHPHLFHPPSKTELKIQIMKLLTPQFSLFSYYIFLPRSKCSP